MIKTKNVIGMSATEKVINIKFNSWVFGCGLRSGSDGYTHN
jgi:hypothetical protein|tara:strand:- start:73 stop:195 length:123 start_codon:yes stop_codon:yes gene_type:complete